MPVEELKRMSVEDRLKLLDAIWESLEPDSEEMGLSEE